MALTEPFLSFQFIDLMKTLAQNHFHGEKNLLPMHISPSRFSSFLLVEADDGGGAWKEDLSESQIFILALDTAGVTTFSRECIFFYP